MEFIGTQGTSNNALFWPCKSFGSPHVWLSGRNAHLLIFIRWPCHTHNWSQTSHLFWKGYDPPPSITCYLLLHSAPCWFGVMIIAFSLGVSGSLLCKLALPCMCVKSMLSLLFPLNALSKKYCFQCLSPSVYVFPFDRRFMSFGYLSSCTKSTVLPC